MAFPGSSSGLGHEIRQEPPEALPLVAACEQSSADRVRSKQDALILQN